VGVDTSPMLVPFRVVKSPLCPQVPSFNLPASNPAFVMMQSSTNSGTLILNGLTDSMVGSYTLQVQANIDSLTVTQNIGLTVNVKATRVVDCTNTKVYLKKNIESFEMFMQESNTLKATKTLNIEYDALEQYGIDCQGISVRVFDVETRQTPLWIKASPTELLIDLSAES
jgi:hypothetical protein